ncbi:hypothetical protein BDR03DRAFT_948981 [Suillus americanus]|nr:hypothetical protein BDR03DRAFT_948981 [Suillus americanus]
MPHSLLVSMFFNFRSSFAQVDIIVILVVINILTVCHFPWLCILLSSTKFSTQRVPNRYLSIQRKGSHRGIPGRT